MQVGKIARSGVLTLAAPYAGTVALTALAAGVRQLLDPLVESHHPFLLFLFPVLVAARYAGWRPALLALALGVLLADLLFLQPRGSLGLESAEQAVGLAIYLFVGSAGILLSESERAAGHRAEEYAAGLEREILARQQAEGGVRRLAAIVASADDAIVGLGLDGVIQDWNLGAERLYGYAAGEAIGKSILILMPPDDGGEFAARLEGARGGAAAESFETARLRKDGTRVVVSAVASPVVEQGLVTGVSLITRDLTYTKRLEDQLRQSAKMEAVGRLAGGVAHDFNNLLTPIIGFSELVMECLRPADPLLEHVQEIKRCGDQAAQLTRQLLAYSRKQVLQPRVLDFNRLIAGAAKMLRHLIGEDVELVTRVDPAAGWVTADPTQIEQIVMNLAVNARDAMPQGGTLTVTTGDIELDGRYAEGHPGSRPGRYSVLEVTDTGCGMDQATVKNIFEPFFTTKEVGQGTGLGLATVHGIVKQSGGSIDVASEPGRGTTFRVYLPRTEEGTPSGESHPGPPTAATGSETILVVEDDGAVRAMTRHVLERHGYTVLEASRGAEAVRLAEQERGPIHLVLTDVVMPSAGGRQVAERVAELRPGIKVLYMSGYTDDIVVRHGVVSDQVAFLQKPFTPGMLLPKVREVLDA